MISKNAILSLQDCLMLNIKKIGISHLFLCPRCILSTLHQSEKADINSEGYLILRWTLSCILYNKKYWRVLSAICNNLELKSNTSHLLNISSKIWGRKPISINERSLLQKGWDHMLLKWRKNNVLFKGVPFRNLGALGSRLRGKRWWQEYILKSGRCKLVLDFWAFRVFVQEVVSKVLQLC